MRFFLWVPPPFKIELEFLANLTLLTKILGIKQNTLAVIDFEIWFKFVWFLEDKNNKETCLFLSYIRTLFCSFLNHNSFVSKQPTFFYNLPSINFVHERSKQLVSVKKTGHTFKVSLCSRISKVSVMLSVSKHPQGIDYHKKSRQLSSHKKCTTGAPLRYWMFPLK